MGWKKGYVSRDYSGKIIHINYRLYDNNGNIKYLLTIDKANEYDFSKAVMGRHVRGPFWLVRVYKVDESGFVSKKPIIKREFKTKKRALNFARDWMKKHPKKR